MKKEKIEIDVYKKDKLIVIGTKSKTFVYEVTVNIYYPNYYSIGNTKHFSSKTYIPNYVESFFKNPHTEICCELYSAPLDWLLDNDFSIYIKQKKIRKKKVINLNLKENDEQKVNIDQ